MAARLLQLSVTKVPCDSWQKPGLNHRRTITFYNKTLPAALIVDERKLLFWKKCFRLRM